MLNRHAALLHFGLACTWRQVCCMQVSARQRWRTWSAGTAASGLWRSTPAMSARGRRSRPASRMLCRCGLSWGPSAPTASSSTRWMALQASLLLLCVWGRLCASCMAQGLHYVSVGFSLWFMGLRDPPDVQLVSVLAKECRAAVQGFVAPPKAQQRLRGVSSWAGPVLYPAGCVTVHQVGLMTVHS